jgi:hypothetical protein
MQKLNELKNKGELNTLRKCKTLSWLNTYYVFGISKRNWLLFTHSQNKLELAKTTLSCPLNKIKKMDRE